MERLLKVLVSRGFLTDADAAGVLHGLDAPARQAAPALGEGNGAGDRGGVAPWRAGAGGAATMGAGATSPKTPRVGSHERRANLRAAITKPVRVRGDDGRTVAEVAQTINASRHGLFFATPSDQYYMGMRVRVVFPYAPGDPCNSEQIAKVVRIERLRDGRSGIAVHFLMR